MPAANEKPTDADPPRERKLPEEVGAQAADASAVRWPADPSAGPVAPAAGNAASPERPAAAAPAPPAASVPEDPATPPARPAAHDIQLQVGGPGDSRVEVRVTERAGDVHVSVSTPDARLAGDLRQDLPALASRLEQSGFRAETWRPDAGERQHLAEPPAGGSAQEGEGQPRQNGREQQRDPQQQQNDPDNPDNPSQRKEQGKDFAWLLSSLR
jgi:hypothetical protein